MNVQTEIKKITLADRHAPGVYFTMPEDEYHADPSFSSSGVKDMLVSPLDYWMRSWMNPAKEIKDSPAMRLGSVYHKLILEGDEAMERCYAIAPSKDDYEGLLVSMSDLRAHCKSLDVKSGTTITQAVESIRAVDGSTHIWREIEDKFKAEVEESGLDIVSKEDAEKIKSMVGLIRKHKTISEAFKGTVSEVSIFWFDEDFKMPMKARIDMLHPVGHVGELKTFSNPMRRPIPVQVARTITDRDYHISAVVYSDGVEHAKKFKVDQFYDVPEGFDVFAFKASDFHQIVIVFVGTDVPHVVARGLAPKSNNERSMVWESAKIKFQNAMRLHHHCMKGFGENPWHDIEPIKYLRDEEVPIWALE